MKYAIQRGTTLRVVEDGFVLVVEAVCYGGSRRGASCHVGNTKSWIVRGRDTPSNILSMMFNMEKGKHQHLSYGQTP